MINARKSAFLIILISTSQLVSCVHVLEHIYDRSNDVHITAKSMQWERVADVQLREASLWTITDGLKLYRDQGIDALRVHYREKWNLTYMPIDRRPLVSANNNERIEVAFGAGVRSAHLIGVRFEASTHEFWVVNFSGFSDSFLGPKTHFYVTKRLEPGGARVIVHEDSQFIPSYEITPGNTIVFPVEDLDLLRRMRAWEFPDSYKNTDIDNIEIWLDKNLKNRTRRMERQD